ncbi:MAG TPA: hypothetical protein VF344_06225, partial [Candidatus Limnocylindrales bacterium]
VNANMSPAAQALAATQASGTSRAGVPFALAAGVPTIGLANAQAVSSPSGEDLLAPLTNLSHAHAEQALTLIGVEMPRRGGNDGASGSGTSSAAASRAYSAQSQSALIQAASGSGPAIVDPLWGRSG